MRLVVCRNPLLAGERARKRQDLLAATEADLARVAKAVTRQRKPQLGADQIGLAAGAVLNRHKMAKHFTLTITDDHFAFFRNQASIEAESQLDGIYVIHQSGRGRPRGARGGALIQRPQPSGARVQIAEDGRSGNPSNPPSPA